MRLVSAVATGLLVLFSTAVGVALCEVGYRALLVSKIAPERFTRPISGKLWVFGRPPRWNFDERFGYTYPKEKAVDISYLQDGRVVACEQWTDFNSLGNIGREASDWKTADIRILVFGDSFSATTHNGQTWAHVLEAKLAARFNKKVSVINFGRDGTGLLQMFDQAAARIPEYKPDVAIVAFITNDLQRIRFWRTVTRVDGVWRYLVSPFPQRDPDPLTAYDTGLYHPEATAEWCARMKAAGTTDNVTREVMTAYNRGVNVGGIRTADAWTLGHSFLLARLMHGDPFHALPGFFAFPVVQLASYGEDAGFMQAYKTVVETKVPLVLFHMAFYPEIKEGKEYIMNYGEQRLLESLTAVTGQPIEETTKWIPMPVDKPERMNLSPTNFHPSEFGLELYAEAVANMLIARGHVRP